MGLRKRGDSRRTLNVAPPGTDGAPGAPSQEAPPNAEELAQHIPSIRRYMAKILRRDEVDDGVQTVLARALESFDRFRGESSARVWLLGITRNVGYELARARQRHPQLIDDTETGLTSAEMFLEPNPSQEEQLGRKEQQALALAALDGLSLDEKLALLVTYVDGLPGPEAADLLGVSFPAFRQRLSRARQALADRLTELLTSGSPASAEVMAQWQTLLDPDRARE